MADDQQPDDAELASAYLDGEATPDERARVEADPILLAEVERLRAAAAAVAAVDAPSVERARSSSWRSAGDVRRVARHGRGAGAAHPAGQRRVARSPAPGAGDAGADGRRGCCRAGDRRFRRRQPRRSRRLRRRHPSGTGHGVGGGHGSSDHGDGGRPDHHRASRVSGGRGRDGRRGRRGVGVGGRTAGSRPTRLDVGAGRTRRRRSRGD